MPQHNDLSRSLLALDQASTLIAVIEMSQSSWLVAAVVPGVGRHPLKKISPDEAALLGLLRRWQDEAAKAGRAITRIAVARDHAHRRGPRSRASPWPLKPGATASGWRAGCGPATSKPM
jgi:hypothetical protein